MYLKNKEGVKAVGKSKRDRPHQEFVSTPSIESMVSRSIDYLSLGFPVHLTGPAGIGKTATAIYIAKKLNRPYTLIHGHPELTIVDLLGGSSGYSYKRVVDNYIHSVLKEEEKMKEKWMDGHLINAAKSGYTLIYDEFTRTKPEVNNILLPVLEEKIIPLYGMKQKEPYLPIHPDFSVIFTSNPKDYVGVYHLQDSLLDRLVTIEMPLLDRNTEVSIVIQKTGISSKKAEMIVDIVEEVRKLCGDEKHGPSLRASIILSKIIKDSDIPVDVSNKKFASLCEDVLLHSLKKC
jgi:nitric oxide reductase NorQ protein